MERWDVYTKTGEKLEKTIRRGESLQLGEYHLVVYLVLFWSNKVLLQKRKLEKESYPGFWDMSAGGSAMSGEDSLRAVIRETKEEIGLDVSKEDLSYEMRLIGEKTLKDFYFLELKHPEEFVVQEEEVDEVRWFSQEELLEIIQKEEVVPYFFLDQLISIQKNGKVSPTHFQE